jgi:hypothetical protein
MKNEGILCTVYPLLVICLSLVLYRADSKVFYRTVNLDNSLALVKEGEVEGVQIFSWYTWLTDKGLSYTNITLVNLLHDMFVSLFSFFIHHQHNNNVCFYIYIAVPKIKMAVHIGHWLSSFIFFPLTMEYQ